MSRRSTSTDGNLREQARDAIRQAILDLRYAPGSLLSENRLAEELGISRTPIREALRELASGGLVRILPQRGIVVSEPTARDVIEVYQLREQLECFAIERAADGMTQADAATLRRDHAAALAELSANRLQAAYAASIRLHEQVIAMAGNERLARFMAELSDQAHRFGLLTLRHGRAADALREHGEIIDALIRGDGATARARMAAHLRADRDLALRLTLPPGSV